MTITIQFTPWGKFRAHKDNSALKRWLEDISNVSQEMFRGGMGVYPPASAPGAWPNSRTGNLRGTIQGIVTDNSVTIGTNMHYSIYLRMGTSRMARRKMSDNALKEGMQIAGGRLGQWVKWVRG